MVRFQRARRTSAVTWPNCQAVQRLLNWILGGISSHSQVLLLRFLYMFVFLCGDASSFHSFTSCLSVSGITQCRYIYLCFPMSTGDKNGFSEPFMVLPFYGRLLVWYSISFRVLWTVCPCVTDRATDWFRRKPWTSRPGSQRWRVKSMRRLLMKYAHSTIPTFPGSSKISHGP